MYNRVLLPLDGSAFAEKEISHALQLVAEKGTLYLVRVVTAPTLSAFPAEALTSNKIQERISQEEESALGYLDRTKSRISKTRPDLSIETFLRRGNVADSIKSLASELEPDIVVVASEHKSTLEKLFSSSVSNTLIETLDEPVLVVHGPA